MGDVEGCSAFVSSHAFTENNAAFIIFVQKWAAALDCAAIYQSDISAGVDDGIFAIIFINLLHIGFIIVIASDRKKDRCHNKYK